MFKRTNIALHYTFYIKYYKKEYIYKGFGSKLCNEKLSFFEIFFFSSWNFLGVEGELERSVSGGRMFGV